MTPYQTANQTALIFVFWVSQDLECRKQNDTVQLQIGEMKETNHRNGTKMNRRIRCIDFRVLEAMRGFKGWSAFFGSLCLLRRLNSWIFRAMAQSLKLARSTRSRSFPFHFPTFRFSYCVQVSATVVFISLLAISNRNPPVFSIVHSFLVFMRCDFFHSRHSSYSSYLHSFTPADYHEFWVPST